jgi:hypothetical protein
MKHAINELFVIHNGNNKITLATFDYVKNASISILKRAREEREFDNDGLIYATEERYHTNSGKPVKVLDVNGIKLIYLFGEKTWFDTEEELNTYKENFWKEENAKRERNKTLKAINERLAQLTDEELKKLLKNL